MIRKHKQKYVMNTAQAEDTLQNVFSACDIQALAQQVSIRELSEKHRKEALSYKKIMAVAFVFLVLVLLAPLCFRSSLVEISANSAADIQILEHHIEDDIFYMTLSGSNIDYDNIQILSASGTEKELLSVDKASSTISFSFRDEELNIYIPDKDGKTLHLFLSPEK